MTDNTPSSPVVPPPKQTPLDGVVPLTPTAVAAFAGTCVPCNDVTRHTAIMSYIDGHASLFEAAHLHKAPSWNSQSSPGTQPAPRANSTPSPDPSASPQST